jgi:hypothetical protein
MYRSHAGVYGPSKPSSWSPTVAWPMPTASLVGSGEKLGTDSRIGQPAFCGLCRGALFPRSSGIRPNLSVSHKRLLYVDHMRYIWSRVICGPSVQNV